MNQRSLKPDFAQAQAMHDPSDRSYHRSIEVADNEPVIPAGEFYKKETDETSDGYRTVERFRKDDSIIVRITTFTTEDTPFGKAQKLEHVEYHTPAVISFASVIKHVEVEPDRDCGMPWDDQDGWEHDVQDYSDFFDAWGSKNFDINELLEFTKTRGYFCDDRGDHCRVIVTDDSFCSESREKRIQYLRNKGASKQVAREIIAWEDRRYIDQIVKWRKYGYPCVFANCDIDIAGELYSFSIGGYEEDYAEEAQRELASEIASALEHDGFIVDGYTDHTTTYHANRLRIKREQMARNMRMFNVGREEAEK